MSGLAGSQVQASEALLERPPTLGVGGVGGPWSLCHLLRSPLQGPEPEFSAEIPGGGSRVQCAVLGTAPWSPAR